MSEYNYSEKKKIGPLASFFLGLFSGGVVAGSITAFFVKKHCDEQKTEAVVKAQDAAIKAVSEEAQQKMDIYLTRAKEEAHDEAVKEVMDDVRQTIDKLFEQAKNQTADIPECSNDSGDTLEIDAGAYADPDIDLDDMNLKIDDEEATDEALAATEQHERYLDMLDRYRNSPDFKPMKISQQDFENDYRLEKVYVSWYEDNVFGIDQENDRAIEDPFAAFGVVDGLELFQNPELREDPDVVHIRNERQSILYEITRTHMTYASLRSGREYFHGGTD